MRSLIILTITILLFSFNFKNTNTRKTSREKWVSLFNGKDLKGWKPKISGYELGENYGNTFRVENGILKVRYDQYGNFDNKFGALYYDRKLSNYRLRVEYRFVGDTAPGAPSWGYRDSGVQYHCQSPGSIGLKQSFPICLEYNLHGGNGKEERPTGEICANGMYVEINGKRNTSYCTLPTIQKTFHGDQWVTLEIDIKDGGIKHLVNGEVILEYKNPRYDPANEIAKTLINGNDDVVKSGYISLQSNSHPIDFRKIEIMEN
jgi:hypothetical protein